METRFSTDSMCIPMTPISHWLQLNPLNLSLSYSFTRRAKLLCFVRFTIVPYVNRVRRRVLSKPLLLSSLSRALKKSTALNSTLQHSTALQDSRPTLPLRCNRSLICAGHSSSASSRYLEQCGAGIYRLLSTAQGTHPPLPHIPSNSAGQGSSLSISSRSQAYTPRSYASPAPHTFSRR